MNAYIPICYPPYLNENQQEQWFKAVTNVNENGVYHFHIYFAETIDDNNMLHQVVVIKESPSMNIRISAMRFVHAFKAYASFVTIGKVVFAEKIKEHLKELFNGK